MKRLLVVQQYRPPGSFQDRQRGRRYASLLRSAGYEAVFAGRHPMPALQDPRGPFSAFLGRSLPVKAWNRVWDRVTTPMNDARVLRAAKKADVVLLLKVDAPRLVRALRERTRARVVFDLADTIWLDARGRVRQDVVDAIGSADAITVDNSFGFEFARRLGPPVHLWPSAAYVEEFDARRARSRRAAGRVVLGWIGSHTTAPYLLPVVDALADVLRRHPEVELRLYGVPPGHEVARRLPSDRVTTASMYTTEEMIDAVLDLDVGLYPLPENDEGAMHGTTKGVIYMAGGAVVVASPVADVAKLVEDGRTGFHARGHEEWVAALERLVAEEALRARMRDAALAKVRERNSLEACFEALRPALEGA